ncbi:MAG TPA: hypothetical protein PJ984_04005 [Candidatus Saccharibacteria bacterium]|nr:hypothetical protein [Candidatus Saccharibacteria bacterium]
MSEQSPSTNQQESAKSAYDKSSGLTYKEYLLQGGEMGQNLRAKAQPSTKNSEQSAADELTLRPVQDGELGDNYLNKDYNSNPEHEDYLPIGVMTHEPWTIADSPEPNQPKSELPSDDSTPRESAGGDGRYSYNGSDLFGGGKEVPGRVDDSNSELPNIGYDGPVEPGSEIELAGPTDIEPYNPGPSGLLPVEGGPTEIVRIPEVDPQLVEALNVVRTRYAQETAKSRKSYLGRFLQSDTQVGGIIAKIPGVKQAVDGWNKVKASKVVAGTSEYLDAKVFEKSLIEARTAYENAYNALSAATATELSNVGWDEETVAKLSLIGNISQDARFEEEVLYQRQAQSKDTNKFVNWWVGQKGFTGKLKKAGVVVAAGAATGLTAGIFAGATAAFIAGGVAGGSIGNHVTKRRANSVDEFGLTLAVRQSRTDRTLKNAAIIGRHEGEGIGSVNDIINRTEGRTDDEMLGNRKRIRTATLLGAAAGKGAFKLKELFDGSSDGAPKTPNSPKKPQPKAPETTPEAPAAEPIPRPEVPINGREFYVDSGHGFTHEIQEFAQANGSNVDARKAFDMYNEAVAKFGEDGLIEPVGTYLRDAGDFGISAPGNAQWKPGVAEFFKSKLQ